MENFFLASKAHILYMYMYEPSVARLRNFLGIPLKQFFPGMGINSLGGRGMFVDQTFFHSSLLDKLFFSNFLQNKLFFLKKTIASPRYPMACPLPTCDQKNGNLNEVYELITNDDPINKRAHSHHSYRSVRQLPPRPPPQKKGERNIHNN